MLWSYDTETTGLDLKHGARPFLISMAPEDKPEENVYWEWRVDPLIRQPIIPKSELLELREHILGLNGGPRAATRLVLQHGKFDYRVTKTIIPRIKWPWDRTDDTLISGHLLHSSQPHDLTSMVLLHCGLNIKPFEDALEEAVRAAVKIIKKQFPTWRIAKQGLEEMPSAKPGNDEDVERGKQDTSPWKYDMWTPRELAIELGYPADHPWHSVARLYNCADSTTTVVLKLVHEKMMADRGLQKIYKARLEYLPVIAEMEEAGVTLNYDRLKELEEEYREYVEAAEAVCKSIAKGYGFNLELPKSGVNDSLRHFIFGALKEQCPKCGYTVHSKEIPEGASDKVVALSELTCPECKKVKNGKAIVRLEQVKKPYLGMPPVELTKSRQPSLKSAVIETYQTMLEDGKPLLFFNRLKGKRSRDTALTYMESYQRFWVPVQGQEKWFRLYPSLNPTGTSTLRCSSSNPNEQNISKKEDFNLRYMFGPTPGREWWSLDYQNLELRIPAYVSNERVMIELFEKPDDAPYFGSYHLMNASIIYPDLFYGKVCPHCWDIPDPSKPPCKHAPKVPICEIKGAFKKKYEATWYRFVKGFGFAFSYGCMEPTGDRAAHKKGAFNLVKDNLKEHSKLNAAKIEMANRLGYVETLPDLEVDPDRGYPLEFKKNKWGKISPTEPLNYFVQGTACWIMMRAMVKLSPYLKTLKDTYMVMQIHDELVIDMPYSANKGNLPIAQEISRIMASVGDCVEVPLTTGISYHPHNWSEEE